MSSNKSLWKSSFLRPKISIDILSNRIKNPNLNRSCIEWKKRIAQGWPSPSSPTGYLWGLRPPWRPIHPRGQLRPWVQPRGEWEEDGCWSRLVEAYNHHHHHHQHLNICEEVGIIFVIIIRLARVHHLRHKQPGRVLVGTLHLLWNHLDHRVHRVQDLHVSAQHGGGAKEKTICRRRRKHRRQWVGEAWEGGGQEGKGWVQGGLPRAHCEAPRYEKGSTWRCSTSTRHKFWIKGEFDHNKLRYKDRFRVCRNQNSLRISLSLSRI